MRRKEEYIQCIDCHRSSRSLQPHSAHAQTNIFNGENGGAIFCLLMVHNLIAFPWQLAGERAF